MSQTLINPKATGRQSRGETRMFILEAIAATGDIVTAATKATPTTMGNREITTGIITMEAIANAAEADHSVALAEGGTAGKALNRLPNQDRVRLARRENATGGHTTEATQSL